MSSETTTRRLPRLLPAIILVIVIVVALGAGYYIASGERKDAKVDWNINPLRITLSTATGVGVAPNSFTCSLTVSPVTLKVFSSSPDTITFNASPSSFPSCGSSPDNVIITATCIASSQSNGNCGGQNQLTGIISVCGPTPYQCMPRPLVVLVTVGS